MKRILVPIDGSANAMRALTYVLNLFRGDKVEFMLFQSFDIPTYTVDMPVPIDVVGAEELKRVLDKLVSDLKSDFSDQEYQFTTLVEQGALSFNVEQLVEREKIDLVVMGTKGASGLSAALIGTNTVDVIQTTTCPLLVVPDSVNVAANPVKILFASDNKGLSDSLVIAPVIELASKFNSHVHIMNVLDEGKMTTVDEAVAGLKLDHMLEKLEHTFYFENSNDKVHAIEEYLVSHEIDLLAVIPRKNNFFDSIFHKSVTRKLALHTKIPILVMHDLG